LFHHGICDSKKAMKQSTLILGNKPRYAYQKTNRYFAQIPGGMETIAVAELEALGAQNIEQEIRGAHFTIDREGLYRITYQARLITRVLAPLVHFPCRDRNDIYRVGNGIEWANFFSVYQTFGIFSNVSGNPQINHSNFASLCLKDGVVDYFRTKFGERPNVERETPDVWLNLHIEQFRAVVSIDVSGGAMNRRGYRAESVVAPMQETLAAVMIAHSGWQGEKPLYDPMCGSGTLLCEALMRYCRIPSGYLKKRFGFFLLPDFDRSTWLRIKETADAEIRPLPAGLIGGSDIDREAITAARRNIGMLPGGKEIRLRRIDYKSIEDLSDRMIVCNPPYGIRMNDIEDLSSFYKELGDFFKQRCKGSTAFVFFGNREMMKSIGLKAALKIPMRNAGIDGRIVRLDLY
jgi:putative N6-adenine-specific DNA methylase